MATRKRIQVYVNDATYAQIEEYAHREDVSISEAAGQLLNTHLVPASQPSSSDYVTRREMELELAKLEASYQSACEAMMNYQTQLFVQAMDDAVEQRLLKAPKKR